MKDKTVAKRLIRKNAREAEYWAEKSHNLRTKDGKAKALQLILGYVDRMEAV